MIGKAGVLLRGAVYAAIMIGAIFTGVVSFGNSLGAAVPDTDSLLLLMTVAAVGRRTSPAKMTKYCNAFCISAAVTIALKWLLRSIGLGSLPFFAWTVCVIISIEALFQLLISGSPEDGKCP